MATMYERKSRLTPRQQGRLSKYDYVGIYWSRHTDMVIAAGGQPKEFISKMSENELFSEYARVCLHLQKIPTRNELSVAQRTLGTRTSTVGKSSDNKADFLLQFRNWLLSQNSSEYKAILDFSGWETRSVPKQSASIAPTIEPPSALHKIHPFLPAGLLDFSALARNEDATSARLFEQRCADAFRALGFDVVDLGQGKGRVPDALALARGEGYAIIIDAKAYADGFSLNATEERKLKEYAENYAEEMNRYHGIKRTYLCIISSSCNQADLEKSRKALTSLPIKGVSLWSAAEIVRIVESSIKERVSFRLNELEERFNNRFNS